MGRGGASLTEAVGEQTRSIDGLAIVGPTASGKTDLANAVALRHRDLVPIAVDALTVYDGLPITTAMPAVAVIEELGYRCVAHVPVDREYSLGQFLHDLDDEFSRLRDKRKRPLFVGGTALWIRAVVNGFVPPRGAPGVRGWLETRLLDEVDERSAFHLLSQLDPTAAEGVDPRNRRRLQRALEVALASGGTESVAGNRLGIDCKQRYPQIGLTLPSELHERRIRMRIDSQIADGWVDEVARVLTMNPSRTARVAIGVAEITAYLEGQLTLDEAIETIARRTRRLVKRQLSWLRRDPRIVWMSSIDDGVELADRLLSQGCDRTGGKGGTLSTSSFGGADSAGRDSKVVAGSQRQPAIAAEQQAQRERRSVALELVKFTGAGNDFLIGEAVAPLPDAETITALLDRSYGIGADGLIMVDLGDTDRPVMHLFNQDGSRAEMSGNGLRCLGHYLVARHGLPPSQSIVTDAGVRRYRLVEQSNWAWVGETTMGSVVLDVEEDGTFLVDLGNPHRVIVLDSLAELEEVDIALEGARYQEEAIKTDGINVEWMVRSEDGCVMRVFERGVGPTMACGTGSVAVASVARHLGWVMELAVIENPGGELMVHFVPKPSDRLTMEASAGRLQQGEPPLDVASDPGGEDEVWLRGPSLLIADMNPAGWLFSS
jgi:tRNA dimethylallyltransferase/diaminopimelate epimerase